MNDRNGLPIIVQEGNQTLIYPTVCFSYEEEKQNHGIFREVNNLDYIFPAFMVQSILAFLASWSVYFVLRPLKQPKFVCNVLAGIILGPSVLGRNQTYLEKIFAPKETMILNTFARFGTAYFVFIVAVKMDTDILLKSAKKIWPTVLLSYILPFAVTLIFTLSMQKELSPCVDDSTKAGFFSGQLAVVYFPVLAQAVEELDLLTTEFGQLALSSSILIQMAGHFLTLIGLILTRDTFIISISYFVVVCGTVLFLVFVIRPVILLIIKRTPEGKPVQEIYVIAILVWALIMSVITDLTWCDSLSGAFIMGLVVPDGPPFGAMIVEKAELMVMEFFMPLFFVQIGYVTDISSLKSINNIFMILLVVFVCYSTRIIGTLLASLYLNLKFHTALLLGVILNFKGVIDFAVFHLFQSITVLDKQCYTTLVLFNILFVGIFHPLIEISYKPQVRLAREHFKTKRSRSLQSALPGGELRVLTCTYHEDNVHAMIAMLEAMNNEAISPLCAYVVHAIDLIGKSAPSLIPYKGEKRRRKDFRGSSMLHIMQAFENYSNNCSGHVWIQPFVMEAPFRTMHNLICNLAEERHIPFIIIPFHGNQTMGTNLKQKGALQDFNSQLQENAPCTVGILFDRGLKCPCLNKLHKFPYQIGVLFVGGADDREALALAIRMSGNPHVKITVLKISFTKESDTIWPVNITETQLDDLLIKEFSEKNVNNPDVVCHQVKVNNSSEMLNVVQSLPKTYDLIVVGKNSGARHFESDLMEWVEYPELGVVGDMLASTYICAAKLSSVLVMQHCLAANKSLSISSCLIHSNEMSSQVLPAVH